MKFTLIAFIVLFLFEGCGCSYTNPVYPVPDKVKFSVINQEYLESFIVTDSLGENWKYKVADSSLYTILTPLYQQAFENERIETIDFKDNLKASVQIYSNGNIVKSYETDYAPFSSGYDFLGTLDNSYLTIYFFQEKKGYIKYYTSFDKKKGQINPVNNLKIIPTYADDNANEIIRNHIKNNNLTIGDTVFRQQIRLEYVKY